MKLKLKFEKLKKKRRGFCTSRGRQMKLCALETYWTSIGWVYFRGAECVQYFGDVIFHSSVMTHTICKPVNRPKKYSLIMGLISTSSDFVNRWISHHLSQWIKQWQRDKKQAVPARKLDAGNIQGLMECTSVTLNVWMFGEQTLPLNR